MVDESTTKTTCGFNEKPDPLAFIKDSIVTFSYPLAFKLSDIVNFFLQPQTRVSCLVIGALLLVLLKAKSNEWFYLWFPRREEEAGNR